MGCDLKIVWNAGLAEGDFEASDGDLLNEDGLETAAIISLFTDRRANDDDILPFEADSKRGWWGDLAAPEIEGDQIGSKLWLLMREKTTERTLERARQYIQNALAWMIEDGIAASIGIDVQRVKNNGSDRLEFLIEIKRAYGTEKSSRYSFQWDAQIA